MWFVCVAYLTEAASLSSNLVQQSCFVHKDQSSTIYYDSTH